MFKKMMSGVILIDLFDYGFDQVRVVDAVPPTGDYAFAKYNKVIFVNWHWKKCWLFGFDYCIRWL